MEELNHGDEFIRTGTVWTVSAHIVTAMVGPAVLSLSWAISHLGWIAGPAMLFFFAIATYYASILLAAQYRKGEKRNHTYMDAVRASLGNGLRVKLCGASQYLNLLGVAIGCTNAAQESMMAIKILSKCFHSKGINGLCKVSSVPYIIAFGVVELILSQIPSFHHIWWLSIISASMCMAYSSIVICLGVAKVAKAGEVRGSLSGIRIGEVTKSEKIFTSFQVAGSLEFSYSFSVVLLEIQDTIESPLSEYKTMKRATLWSIIIATIFYMLCGCVGYAAFGDPSPVNLLTGFGIYKSIHWLLDVANAAIILHHIGAYQVFCQPIFAFIEKTASEWFPSSTFVNQEIQILRTKYKLNLFKIVSRCIFVIMTTTISIVMPFSGDGLGALGAIGLWRLTFHLPVAMHIAQDEVPKWSKKWICLKILSMACFVISLAAAVGSFAGLVSDVKRKLGSHH